MSTGCGGASGVVRGTIGENGGETEGGFPTLSAGPRRLVLWAATQPAARQRRGERRERSRRASAQVSFEPTMPDMMAMKSDSSRTNTPMGQRGGIRSQAPTTATSMPVLRSGCDGPPSESHSSAWWWRPASQFGVRHARLALDPARPIRDDAPEKFWTRVRAASLDDGSFVGAAERAIEIEARARRSSPRACGRRSKRAFRSPSRTPS